MPNDIRHDGRGALLAVIQPNTDDEKRRARAWIEAEATDKAGDTADQATAELLAMVGLSPEGDDR